MVYRLARKMKVEIYRVSDECWQLVTSTGETCDLDELPSFFDVLDFRNAAGDIVKYKLLYFTHITENGNLQYVGESYK